MAFEATKREWCELATFFKLLADGTIALGTTEAMKTDTYWPIAMIQREEHNGPRQYFIETKNIKMQSEKGVHYISRNTLETVSHLIIHTVKEAKQNNVLSPDGIEDFLNEIDIFNLEAETKDRTDLSISFWHPKATLHGFNVRSRLSSMNPLLDGGRTANLKLEQGGIKFAVPAVNKINALPQSPNEVAERMLMIERLGGILRYSDVADRIFRCNLQMIDLHFPRILTEMVRTMHLDGITRISELTEIMKQRNPLKIKDELISKHGFYEYKIKQFLIALTLGMRPAKLYKGEDTAIEGLLFMNGDGDIMCYHKSERKIMEEFLFQNTRLEKGSLDKDKYGFLERENGKYYFKLNAKIGFIKR